MSRLIVTGIALVVATAITTAVVLIATGSSSTVCADGRVFLESQSGWSDVETETYGQAQHVHSGTCFPYRQVLDGDVTLDIRTLMHNVPGWYLRFLRVYACSDQDGCKNLKSLDLKTQQCQAADCEFNNSVTVNLAPLAAGTYEFRIHSEARPAIAITTANLATNGWQACVRSCVGRTPQATDNPEGRGWYKTPAGSVKGYVNGRYNALALPATIAGTYCFPVRILKGSGDEPVERSFVSVDPAFHAVPENPGQVLLDQAGTFTGNVCLDTTTLANGPHKLFLRAYSSAIFPGQLWGSFVVPFEVVN